MSFKNASYFGLKLPFWHQNDGFKRSLSAVPQGCHKLILDIDGAFWRAPGCFGPIRPGYQDPGAGLGEDLGERLFKGGERAYRQDLLEAGAPGNCLEVGFAAGVGRLPARKLVLGIVPDDVNKIGGRLFGCRGQ
jgi:hypothetical protein